MLWLRHRRAKTPDSASFHAESDFAISRVQIIGSETAISVQDCSNGNSHWVGWRPGGVVRDTSSTRVGS